MRALVFLSGLLAASAVSAADCRQDRAIYADRDGAYEFVFEPVGSDAAVTSHHFKVRVAASGVVLDGIVMPGDEAPRSGGMIFHDCPEGDVTGEEIAACTVWDGEISSLDAAGAAVPLPQEGDSAADKLRFTGLGPSVRASNLWEAGKATVAPWDVLTFKGCAS